MGFHYARQKTCCWCCAYPTLRVRYIPYSVATLYTDPIHRYSTCRSYPTATLPVLVIPYRTATQPVLYTSYFNRHPTGTMHTLPCNTLPVPFHTGDKATHPSLRISRLASTTEKAPTPSDASEENIPSRNFRKTSFGLCAVKKRRLGKSTQGACCQTTRVMRYIPSRHSAGTIHALPYRCYQCPTCAYPPSTLSLPPTGTVHTLPCRYPCGTTHIAYPSPTLPVLFTLPYPTDYCTHSKTLFTLTPVYGKTSGSSAPS